MPTLRTQRAPTPRYRTYQSNLLVHLMKRNGISECGRADNTRYPDQEITDRQQGRWKLRSWAQINALTKCRECFANHPS